MSTTAWYSIQVNYSGGNFLTGYFCTVNNIITKFYETVNGVTNYNNNLIVTLENGIVAPGSYYKGFQNFYCVGYNFDNAYMNGWTQFDPYGVLLFNTSKSKSFYDPAILVYLSSNNLGDETINNTGSLVFFNPDFYHNNIINATFIITPTTNPTIPKPYPCFKENTQILTNQGYQYIQNLKKGDLISTVKNDYKPLIILGKRDIEHNPSSQRIKKQLYKCSQNQYPDLFEDLIITGCHSILTPQFSSEKEKENTILINGDTYVTDGYYRLPACCDYRASVYETPGTYTIYHLVLENEDYYMNYGIYANGLLVESCSEHNLKNYSMEVLQ